MCGAIRQHSCATAKATKGTSEMSIREIWEIAKTITIGDVIGAISLFGLLFVGLFFVMVFQ